MICRHLVDRTLERDHQLIGESGSKLNRGGYEKRELRRRKEVEDFLGKRRTGGDEA